MQAQDLHLKLKLKIGDKSICIRAIDKNTEDQW